MTIKNNLQDFLKNKNLLISISCGTIILLFSVGYLISANGYSISKKVIICADTVPENIKYYIEIKNPAGFLDNFKKRPYGKAILENEAWKKFAAAEQVKKFSSLLYLIELRGGVLLKQDEIASLFDGSAGYGIMPDDSFLVVAKLSVQSKLGFALITSIKGEKIEIKPEKKKDPDKKNLNNENEYESGKKVTSESFENQIREEKIEIGNVKISALTVSDKKIYIVVLDNFLFMSDSIDTLKLALETGSKAQNSITSYNGGENLSNSYGNSDMLVYASKKDGIFSAFSPLAIKGKAIAGIIRFEDSISMDIYNLGFEIKQKDSAEKIANGKNTSYDFDSMIPKDSTLSFLVYDKTLADISALFQESGISNESKEKYEKLFQDLSFNSIKYGSKGSAFILRKLALNQNKLIPEFMLAFHSNEGETVAKSLFKTETKTNSTYQNKEYLLFSKNTENSFYSPAVLKNGDTSIVTSTTQNALDVISSLNKNNPVLADGNSYTQLKSFSAPCRIVVNIPALLETVKNFYYYGADNNKNYTRKTIDSDIIPLLDFLKGYSELNIAFGNEGLSNGKAVFSKL